MPFLRLANNTGLLLSPMGAKTVVLPDTSFPAAADGRLWLNLDFAADWTPDNFLIDVMRSARAWRAGVGATWNDTEQLADMMATADADGYPTEMPGTVDVAGTVILNEQDEGSAPALAGRYRLEWLGAGTVNIWGAVSGETSGANWAEFDFTPNGSSAVFIDITALPNPADNIRAMHCYNLDHAALRAAGQVVNPAFKAAWPNISLIRPMQSFETNTNTNGDWAFAPTPTSIGRGACNEDMIAAANEMGCNLWINIPSRADANYVTQVATLVRDNLNPALKCYVEYANEWWNWASGFTTYPYLEALRTGESYNFAEMAGGRSCETMVAWSAVFAGQMERTVRVAGMHTGWLGLEEDFLNAPGWVADGVGRVVPHTVHDAIAVTGYFNVDDDWEETIDAAEADYATGYAMVIAKAYSHIEALRTSNFPHFRDVADTYGMDMLMYEGGSHAINPGSTSNSSLVNTLLADFNTGADLYDVYDAMFNAWHQFSEFPFNQFVGISDSAFGCMAHLNDTSQPRYQAMLDYNDRVLPSISPRPLSNRLIVTGHSITDAMKGPLATAVEEMGGTPAMFFGTGPFAGAQYRWENDPAGPLQVRSLLEAGGASYDAFIGIEASDYYSGSYRTTVQQFITSGNAFQYALEWHNAAAATGAQPYYGNFWQNDPAELFDSAWRNAQDAEVLLWDSIIDHVNTNKDIGTPDMLLVPWLQVFMAIYDAIEAGTVTGVTMADFFEDSIHQSTVYGRWAQIATVMLVVFHREPSEVPANAGTFANIDPDVAAQLRPVIRAACFAAVGTGLG